MAATTDGQPRGRDRKTSTTLRAEYSGFINADEGLQEARRWIERVTFTKFRTSDFRESLADGVLLCELVVNVASMSIGRINRSSTQYAGADNIKLFQRACQALGFEKSQLFDIDDLQEVPVKRGQSVLDRAKETQKRLAKVARTVYYLGQYANENLNFTGSSALKEECFEHILKNELPELPVLEGAELGRRISQYEPSQAPLAETTPEKDENKKNEIVTETGNFNAKRNTFEQLEEESLKKAQEEALLRSRRRSFSSGDKENESTDEALKRRKSLGSKPVWKEGDSRYKHKREILSGVREPVKNRRERIAQNSAESTESSPSKQPVIMRSPVDLQRKRSKFEEMERTAQEESEGLDGKRARPKSWVAGDYRSRQTSLKDKANKFEDMQKQADKESAVLHGELRMPAVDYNHKKHDRIQSLPSAGAVKLKDKHSKFEQLDKVAQQQTLVLQGKRDEIDYTYDIGDKVSGPITLPGAADPKLQDKRKQFESLDYKAQRESTILRLHSGKSFDDPNHNPIPLNTASRRGDPNPRPKSNVFDYQRFPTVDVDRKELINEPIQTKEMDFSQSSPDHWNSFDDRGSSKSVSPTPPPPPRSDSLRRFNEKPEENTTAKPKTTLYSSFAAKQDPNEKAPKKEMKYKEFVQYPVVKQRDRVERYNAALQELSKEPDVRKTSTGERPRKKSIGSDEWIKHKAAEEPDIDIPKKPIKKLWERDPVVDDDEPQKPVETVDTSFDERKISTHVPNVGNISYRDFTAAPKNIAKKSVVTRAPVVELVSTRKKSENRAEPFSNFAPSQSEETAKAPTKKQSMSYHDFVVPPPKVDSSSEAAARAKKVQEMTKKFQEIEAEQNKPKPGGRPGLKSLVDRDELVRYERESRARSWYGVDDEEFEGATRRRVRRWSDYEYEEGDRMGDVPKDYQNGEINGPEPHPVFEDPEPYRKPLEPEPIERVSYPKAKQPEIYHKSPEPYHRPEELDPYHRPVEPEPYHRRVEPEPYRKPVEPEPYHRRVESEPYRKTVEPEPYHRRVEPEPYRKPVEPEPYHRRVEPEPYRKPVEPEPVKVQQHKPVEAAKEWYEVRPPPPVPVAPKETEIKAEPPKPVKSILRHDPISLDHYEPPAPESEPPVEPRAEPAHIRVQPRPVVPQGRTVVSRSWNDFESARRKKSMELLEHRPAVKPQETRSTTRVENEPYKLKRPTDYLSKHQAVPKTTRAVSPQPEVKYTHQYQFESEPQDPYSSNEDTMPTSYPTYYEPDMNASNSPVVVETGKPLFVTARLHEKDESKNRKPPSPTPGYDIPVAEKVGPPEVESNIESEPQDFKTQRRLWEFKTTNVIQEPEPSQSEVNNKEQPVHKYVVDPDSKIIESKEPVKVVNEHIEQPKPKRPQVFAIVGHAHPVRPSPVEPQKPVSPIEYQTRSKESSPTPVKQPEPASHRPKQTLTRTPSGAKVFDFNQENEDHPEENHVEPVSQPVAQPKGEPTVHVKQKENTVVLETVTVVEKGRGLDEDIFKSLNDDEERIKRNLQDPVYREKLRKEVEVENRKQREEINYLTNLQMKQPLGPNEDNFIHEEEERLRQEKLESVNQKKHIYDYNANRNDYPVIEKQMNGLEHSPPPKEIPLYPEQRKNDEDPRYERERRGRSPPRVDDRERRGRSPHRHPSTEQEHYDRDRRRSRERPPSSDRDRYKQERRGRSPHRRPSPDRGRHENERRRSQGRYPSSERGRDRSEEERRGRSPHRYPSSERDRYDQRGRSPHRDRDEYYRERDQRGPQDRRREQEYRERERRDAQPKEHERREVDRKKQERVDAERRERERREPERREQERREVERREHERREVERREHERREAERREAEKREAERKERERIEQERKEAERRELERTEAERREVERREAERKEWEREQERLERERIEKERKEQERIAREQERIEIERREREEQQERERLERERMEQELLRREQIEQERIEQERIERERRDHERLERERIEQKRREEERLEWERLEKERLERERLEQEREYQRMEQERRGDDRRRREPERRRHERDRYDRDRHDSYNRTSRSYDDYDDKRRDDDRYEHDRKERERRERHRREQEQFSPEERERHRMEQQQHVHEIITKQRQEEVEQEQYKEMLSKEQQYLYGTSEKRRSSDDDGMWKKIDDGSGYDIYSTYLDDERSSIVCSSCGMSIVKDRAMYVRELNQYWHETCFRCVICHVIFGSREQRSPLKITDTLLHCENCFITNEGEKCTEV